MSRAVCRNCWTWYTHGETICPSCKVALMAEDTGAPAFSAGSAAVPPPPPTSAPPGTAPGMGQATPSGFNWLKLLPVGVVVALLVIGLAVAGSLNLGGPATASDGSFSVKNPGGWYPTTFSFIEGRRVVLALEAQKGGGKSDFAVADFGQQVPLERIPAAWEQMQVSGQFDNRWRLGGMHAGTVGGAPAMIGEISGTQEAGQLIFLNYNNTTYIVVVVSTNGTYSQMRHDFDVILASWSWLH